VKTLTILILCLATLSSSAPVISYSWFETVAADTLNSGLIAYWKLDEASGTRVDSEPTGTAQDLTDNNTVTSATGRISNGAFFTSANSEYLSHADSADLSTTRMVAAWVKATTLTAGMVIVLYWSVSPSQQRSWRLWWDSSTGKFKYEVSGDGIVSTSIQATTFGTPVTNVLYFVAGWIDTTGNTLNISINNGTVNSVAYSSGILNSTATFDIGARGAASDFWNGLIDEVGVWNRPLTAIELTRLYNLGAGRTCCAF